MIKGFSKETAPLNDYEIRVLLPVLIAGLKTKSGSNNAVTNKYIVRTLKRSGYKISEPRIRKLVNYIRTNDLVPGLIATSGGYFIAESETELLDYEESLLGREEAIREVRLSIARQRRVIYEKLRAEKQTKLFNN